MTITEFLLARIAEDEALARSWARAYDDPGRVPAYHYETTRRHRAEWPMLWRHLDAYRPERVLAECAAKRAIVEQSVAWDATLHETAPGHNEKADTGYRMALHWTMGTLAAIYADHPDFDPAWRM